ncbi:ABC transporter substrate-binding protein [Streptomyces sp. A7024]|uniref:ABC transporter substrate-binding protein n=1 Tax=Streptomyces coryli TaxID=1128680 RepID=A0A6G4TYN8_9ACTN|nr:ABC transporter substrate-binding protein [Streptomyces coryli]NGN64238.1 ABC transporter substrate-binding protein [Streptomyces coryli]
MPSRRSTVLCTTASAAALALTAACTAGTDTGAGPAGATADGTLTVGLIDAGTTFVRNYNTVSPSPRKAPGNNWVYEPLARVDYADGAKVKPWLAKSLEFDDAGTTLTVKIRDDVKFSDGKPMTADDVHFSLELPLKNKDFNAGGITYTGVKKVDDTTVELTYPKPAFSELNQLAGIKSPIVPKHIWAKQNLRTWTNPKPVGTGPVTVDKFAPQQITFAARKDYWGGALPMKHLKVIPSNPDAVKAQLLRGDIDYASASWAAAKKEYVAKDPKHHHYELYAAGGASSLFYNTAKAPFDNVHLRRALAMTIPRTDVVATLERPGTEAGPSGLVDEIYGDQLLPKYKGKVQKVDGAGAKAELKKSGYTVEGGKLVKDGTSYAPKLLFNQDIAWDPYANMLVKSWEKQLGIKVKPAGAPGANHWEQMQKGAFDLAVNDTFGAGPAGVYSALSSRAYRPLKEMAATNFGRWKDAKTDRFIGDLIGSKDPAKVKAATEGMQRIVAEQVPYSPIYNLYNFVLVNSKRWTGWPTAESYDVVPAIAQPTEFILTLKKLKPAK